MASDGAPQEIELKLAFPPEARRQISAHPAFQPPRGTDCGEQHQRSTYYDTPGSDLAAAGFVLRVRQLDGGHIQTLKSRDGTAGAMGARGEWEWAIGDDAPDLALLTGTPAAQVLGPDPPDLHATLTTDIRRSRYTVSLADDTLVEAALDEGSIEAGGGSTEVHELELELKHGPVGPLYRLAVELHADLPLRLGAAAKSERGMRLRDGAAPRPVKAEDPEMDSSIGAAEAFRVIIAGGLGGLLANQPAALACDMEGVHQMRVALRRLRTAVVLFAPHLERHAASRFNAELGALGRLLGDARDWDVFVAETLPTAFAEPTQESWRNLLGERAAAARCEAHDQLAAELGSARPTGLILALAAWSHEPDLLQAPARDAALIDLAPALLDRLARKVRKRGRHVSRADSKELHDLRKSLKKLRYAADFVSTLYAGKQVHAYLKRCKRLQELLGTINDAAAATSLAERLAAESVELAAPLAHMASWAEARRAKARRSLAKAVATMSDAAPFWR